MRWRSALLTASSVFVLAACGGDEEGAQTVSGPPIDGATADALAERSDNVASLLDRGDACGARREAGRLRGDLNQAIADGTIPEVYLEDLSGLVNEIQAGIPLCEPPPLPPPTTTETGDGGDGDD
jgi:hypothetical protein